MIETTILEYLAERLTVPVLMELPEVPSADYPTMPEEFVVIEKVGSKKTDHVVNDSIAFQSYSTTRMVNAAELDEDVREAMDSIVELNEIGGVRLASNYNFTDIRTKRYRYQCIYEIYRVEE